MSSSRIKYKIILVGNTSVGKTSLYKKLTTGEFIQGNMSTIGMDQATLYSDLEIKNNDKVEKLKFEILLVDTAGQEKFRAITKSYFKQADGILLLYDITNRESFEQIKIWLESLDEALGDHKTEQYMVFLLGNKIDLLEGRENREVQIDEAKQKCIELGFNWGGEISAKTFSQEQLTKKMDEFTEKLYKTLGIKKIGKQKAKEIKPIVKKKKKCLFL
jgi:Ras-related protein Rab-1A